MDADPFDDLLNLEGKFYRDGYNAGLEHGAREGKIEGRTLGLEKGFDKFLESGRLNGKAIVWANRLPSRLPRPPSQPAQPSLAEEESDATLMEPPEDDSIRKPQQQRRQQLPALSGTPRLTKHLTALYALVETASLSTENTDEAVNDFDDRLRRAQGKARIIRRMAGERQSGADLEGS